MKWFTRKKTSRAYPKIHICRITNQFETIALCWHAVNAEQVEWVDRTYKGDPCTICAKIYISKKNKRRGYER